MGLSEYGCDKTLIRAVRRDTERVTTAFALTLAAGSIAAIAASISMYANINQKFVAVPAIMGALVAVAGYLAHTENRKSGYVLMNAAWIMLAAANAAAAALAGGLWRLTPIPFFALSAWRLCEVVARLRMMRLLRRRVNGCVLRIDDRSVSGVAYGSDDGETEFDIMLSDIEDCRYASRRVRRGVYHELEIDANGKTYLLAVDDALSAGLEILQRIRDTQ